jgi:16S rRNA processing protein RimM
MEAKDHYSLGYISKTSGTDCRLVIQADTDSLQRYKKLESFMVDLNGTLTPFFVKSVRIQPPSIIVVEAEDMDEGIAQHLIGKEVFVQLSFLPKLSGKQFYFHEIIGYEVHDKVKGNIGIVKSIYDRSTQPVFQVMQGNIEIMIPVTDDFILKVDREKKILEMDLPEGLVDIYLGTDEEEEPFA